MNSATYQWNGDSAVVVPSYDATDLLNTPFNVVLKHSVKNVLNPKGEVQEVIVPDPDGLVKAVAQARALHHHKLSGPELKFIRAALGMKAKDLAKTIALSPEHLSRVEAGKLVLSPQSEMLVRIFTYVSTMPANPMKDAQRIAKQVGEVFSTMHIKPCHHLDDKVSIVLTRVQCEDGGIEDSDGTWDEPSDIAA